MAVKKMCDVHKSIASDVFQKLNGDNVCLKNDLRLIIVTDIEPNQLIYPEGWYYSKGYFTNKHTSTTGLYGEVRMENSNGVSWGNIVHYCTLD